MRAQDGLDRFFLSRIDERAGVDDEHVRLVSRRRDFHSARQDASQHDLGIHQILGATQTDHPDFHLP